MSGLSPERVSDPGLQVLFIEREEGEEACGKHLALIISDLHRTYNSLLAEVEDIPFGDELFIFARGRADMIEFAFDRCGNLTSGPGSAPAHSVSKRIIDSAMDGSDGIKESGSDRDFPFAVTVAHSGKFQADIVGERAETVVVFDKFFVVHGILLPDIVSVH